MNRGSSGTVIENTLPSRMKMERSSELRVDMVDHLECMAMCGVEIERSGEVGLASEGSRVGESVLSRSRSEAVRVSCMSSPRLSALVSLVCEYQAGW